MRSVIVDIAISPEEYQLAYQGVNAVWARCEDGRRIRFPANILRPFVLHDGVRGRFRIAFDDANKFAGIERLA